MQEESKLVSCFFFLTDMRGDVQEIFRLTPHEKQVMMFSATLSKDIRPVCRKFMQDVSYCQDLLMFHIETTVLHSASCKHFFNFS